MTARPRDSRRRWSQRVTETSNALDLEPGVSMLTFYVNWAGANFPGAQRARLETAKDELRELFGRPRRAPRGRAPAREAS